MFDPLWPIRDILQTFSSLQYTCLNCFRSMWSILRSSLSCLFFDINLLQCIFPCKGKQKCGDLIGFVSIPFRVITFSVAIHSKPGVVCSPKHDCYIYWSQAVSLFSYLPSLSQASKSGQHRPKDEHTITQIMSVFHDTIWYDFRELSAVMNTKTTSSKPMGYRCCTKVALN